MDMPRLLVHALAIEIEAQDRYRLLADQMVVHNRPDLAVLFGRLAEIEGKHAAQIADRARGIDMPDLKPWEQEWPSAESPETTDPTDISLETTPGQALELALAAEQRARDFFHKFATSATDEHVREMAREMAAEEEQHVRLIQQWLDRVSVSIAENVGDMDPPLSQG